MVVSRGVAVVWSAALHTAGIGVVGWATYGRYYEPAPTPAFHTTRVHTLHYLMLAVPKLEPEHTHEKAPAPAPRRPPPPAPEPSPVQTAAPVTRSTIAVPPMGNQSESPPSLQLRELAPGKITSALPALAPPPDEPAPAVRHGVERPASLVAAAGAACPRLPVSSRWMGREVAVAVAFVVDTNGRVDASAVEVLESPGRAPSPREYYPRIYVVGARAARDSGLVDPAGYDSVVTHAVTRHVAGLTFRPALRDGRPVRSAVLVACKRPPGA